MCPKYYSSQDYEEEFWEQVLTEANFRLKRPKSACSVRPDHHERVRAPSSLSLREGGMRWKAEDEERTVGVELYKFRRSLRLLGLNLEHLTNSGVNLTTGENQVDRHAKEPDMGRVRAKVNTRLERRTVSAEDVKTAILLEDPSNLRLGTGSGPRSGEVPTLRNTCGRCGWAQPSPRGLVSRAVYEEWYFKKLEEARKTKEAAHQEAKTRQWALEHAKREQSEKSRECYLEWKNKKTAEKVRKKEKSNEEEDRRESPIHHQDKHNRNKFPPKPANPRVKGRTKPNVDEATTAFLMWKKEKDKELRKKLAEAQKKRKEEIEKEKKKEEAQKAYLSWKKKTDDELKEKTRQKEKEEEEKRETEKRVQEQKWKDAAAIFNRWKQEKDKYLREKIISEREREEMEKASKEERRRVRRYEANQAFLDWLDKAEERRYLNH